MLMYPRGDGIRAFCVAIALEADYMQACEYQHETREDYWKWLDAYANSVGIKPTESIVWPEEEHYIDGKWYSSKGVELREF